MSDNKSNENTNKTTSIHTLESDLASAVMDNNYGKNIIKIVTDPSKNSTFTTNFDNEGKNSKKSLFNKNNIIIFSLVIFVLISISVIFYILYQAKNIDNIETGTDKATTTLSNTSDVVNQPIINNVDILNSEIIQSTDFTKSSRADIVTEINTIKQLLLDKNISANNTVNINTNIDIGLLFEKIKYSGEESLLRSFSNVYAFGLYSNENRQFENYLLIKIDNFDLAFQSILGWEKFMPVDLKDIFVGNNEVIRSSNASSSVQDSVEKIYKKNNTKTFVDKVLKNYDIREYVDNENDTDIIYGFINNKFLLITSGESSFLDIKNRLLKENIQR